MGEGWVGVEFSENHRTSLTPPRPHPLPIKGRGAALAQRTSKDH
jgi:hypothetical protein